LLIPQLENSIRHLLQRAGIVTSFSDQYGIQKEYDLNTLLYGDFEKVLNGILGEDMVFALKSLLVEATGSNLRNDFAHGLINTDGFASPSPIYLWWLVLRLCLVPIWNAERRSCNESNPEQEDMDSEN
jgi:hypothetical protein